MVIDSIIRFNPCFTGSTTSTWEWISGLMPYEGFNPCFTGSTTSTGLAQKYSLPEGK